MPEPFRLGTRGSQLALTQSQQVADAVTAATGVPVEMVVISTRGDQITDRPLPEIGGKGLFTAELELALRMERIDFAVHSLKDLPTEDPDGLILGAIPTRADPRDALVGARLSDLPRGSTVATGSLRRHAQISALRPDLRISGIRGNVPTRLRKRDEGLCEATILAVAGLQRLGIERPDVYPFAAEDMVPAVGQGALAVQCRVQDERTHECLLAIEDEVSRACVLGERAFLGGLGGGCNVPAGCNITKDASGVFQLLAVVATDSGEIRRFQVEGTDPVALGLKAVEALR